MTQILECGRTIAGEYVAFDICWEGDLSQGTVVWSMEVAGADGAEKIRLGHQRTDGERPEQFVDDLATGRRQGLEADAEVGDAEITARFPANIVGVAVEWPVWRAVITVDGADVAERVVTV